MITRNFNLYLNAGHSIPLVINANQAEEGEQWVFSLFQEDGTPYIPTDGSIVGIKSDGYLINNSGTVVDGKVVIAETRQMTAAAGKSVFELRIDGLTHGTANFIVLVEKDPTNGGIVSDSDLSLIEEALSAVSPLPTGGTVGQVLTKTANGSAWSDAGTPTQEQVAEAVSDWASEHISVETGVVIDNSLSVSGAAADAKKTGDEISDLKSQIATGGLKDSVKNALLQIARKVAYIDDGGQDYYDALYDAFYNVEVLSISAVYNTGGVEIFDTATLDDLKQYLTVTANYGNGTSGTVTGYTLSGSMTSGIQEITVSYGGKSATFNATIYHNYANQTFTSWAQGTGVTKAADQITLKSTQANANSWKIWTADKLTNTWGALKEKRLKARLTLYSTDWTGEMSTASPLNVVAFAVGVYSGTSTTSLSDRVITFKETRIVPTSSPTVYETETFTATTENASVTDAYHIGICLYNASANTLILTKAELIEVFDTEESE